MKVHDFDFKLPEELIAQSPIEKRDNSRLMILGIKTGKIRHKHFYDIVDYLAKDDVLVLNETKVFPAKLFGKKEKTGAKIEILLLEEIKKDIFEALVKPAKRVMINDVIIFSKNLKAECIEIKEEGIRIFKLIYEGILLEILEECGNIPLPPYIGEKLRDKNRYQTVFAKNIGSAAAPTAGLHFTNELLDKLKDKGIIIVKVTLNVGLGTFRPLSVENVEEHKMHSEKYEISQDAARILNDAVSTNKKIIAVGTTSLRVLESNKTRKFKAGKYKTDIFIYPGYKFKVVNELITNFHLPKSSLIMLVSALASKNIIMNAYEEAIKEKYRFFSFGDAMYLKLD